MAIQIRVSPEGLRAAAERQKAIAHIIQDVDAQMDSLSSALNAAWDGGASVMALGVFAELRDAGDVVIESVMAGGSKLDSVAQAFEAVDEGNVSPVVAVFDPSSFALLKAPAPSLNDIVFGFSGTLRIVPEEVRQVADQLIKLSNMLEDARAQLNQNLNKLAEEWEGRAFQKYVDETQEVIKGLKKLATSIDDFAGRIRRAAIRYEEIDNMF